MFPPPKEFAAKAHIGSMEQYEKLWKEAAADLEGFWGKMAHELHWFKPYTKVLEWNEPFAKWFVGGQTNVSYNCLDAHLNTPRRNKAAIIWEGEPGDVRVYTYEMLHREVCKFANVLKKLGIKKGDVVAMYMPMVPELAIAMLACTRIGAVHSVVFGGFAAEAIADRNNDAKAKLIITADAGWRRGKQIPLKANVDAALGQVAHRREVHRLQADRLRRDDAGGPRLLVARPDGQGLGRLPRRADGQRDPAVHPLHQRIDRQAQGHQAHHRRLQPLRQEDDGVGVRHPRRRRLLVYGRHRLDHRPHVRRLRPADGRGDDLHVRRLARHARTRAAGGR